MKTKLSILFILALSGASLVAQETANTGSAAPSAGSGNAAAQANNPLANTTAFNIHNYYIGEFTGLNDDGDQVFLRYARPFEFAGGEWLMRATLPFNTYPGTSGHESGIGDFNVFAAYLMDTGNPGISFGIGPQLTAPTATNDAVGSEKWSAGFANVLFNATSKKFQYGYLLTWQTSFAGDDDRADVNTAAFQPFAFYQLGDGWYLRNTGVMVYDFESDGYTVPLGLGIGRVIPTDKIVYNVFVEPQYSIWDEGAAFPEWQIFTGFNMQF